jgi:uncharacterized protein (TIGR02145 family)
MVITNGIFAQGITKYGESTNSSSNFVNTNGQIGSSAALNKNGQILGSITLATLTTTAATSITTTSASSGGNITSNGGAIVTARGVCWNTSANPTIANSNTNDGTGNGTFTSSITGLNPNTTYYVRAYATNSVGTAYGNQVTFSTINSSSTVTDCDGHTYNTITIGTQVWLASNLKSTHFRDCSAITYSASNVSTPAYCYYATFDSAHYGLFYNWYAVTDIDSLCPTGWHVPTNAEYTTLINYLGGTSAAGGAMKETGTTDWAAPNNGATNSSGFTALPGGYFSANTATDITQDGNFWTSTASGSSAYYIYLYYGSASVVQNNAGAKTMGLSVRCKKN